MSDLTNLAHAVEEFNAAKEGYIESQARLVVAIHDAEQAIAQCRELLNPITEGSLPAEPSAEESDTAKPPANGGAGDGAKSRDAEKQPGGGEMETEQHPIVERIIQFLDRNGCTVWTAPWPKSLKTTNQSIKNLIEGKIKRPAAKTIAALEKALDEMEAGGWSKPEKRLKHPEYSKPKKKELAPEAGNDRSADAMTFIKNEVMGYIGIEDIKVAAMQLSVSASAIEEIQIGIFPHPNAIERLAKHIPGINDRCSELIAIAKAARE